MPLSRKQKAAGYLIPFSYLFYLVGVAGFSFDPVRPWMLFLTPWALFVWGAAVIALTAGERQAAYGGWCLGFFTLTVVVEIIGVKSGHVFGQYSYGSRLGPELGGVPLVIGMNWLVMTLGATVLIDRPGFPMGLRVIGAGLTGFLFDLALEPVAVRYAFWQWAAPFVPVQNYLVWSVLTMLGAALFFKLKLKPSVPLAAHYLLAQMMFLLLLGRGHI